MMWYILHLPIYNIGGTIILYLPIYNDGDTIILYLPIYNDGDTIILYLPTYNDGDTIILYLPTTQWWSHGDTIILYPPTYTDGDTIIHLTRISNQQQVQLPTHPGPVIIHSLDTESQEEANIKLNSRWLCL